MAITTIYWLVGKVSYPGRDRDVAGSRQLTNANFTFHVLRFTIHHGGTKSADSDNQYVASAWFMHL